MLLALTIALSVSQSLPLPSKLFPAPPLSPTHRRSSLPRAFSLSHSLLSFDVLRTRHSRAFLHRRSAKLWRQSKSS